MSEPGGLSVAVASDHGGWPLRRVVLDRVAALGHELIDLGPPAEDPLDDYPDHAAAVARAVADQRVDRGILLCGSGVGVTVAANKIAGVRACLCHDCFSAAQGVADDDMNVLCLGARVIGAALAGRLVETFLAARYRGDVPRFARRVAKIADLERGDA
jgi:ribose 5-phosphate isomerase B